MSQKNSKSIKDYFTAKVQHPCSSRATTSTQRPEDEQIGETDGRPRFQGHSGLCAIGLISKRGGIDSKEEESLNDSSCDSFIDQDKAKEDEEDDDDDYEVCKQDDELNEGGHYYWKNFLYILTQVLGNQNLKDVFSQRDLSVLKEFNELHPKEQKLYVRLLNRKHSWLKTSSIRYDDINPLLNPIIKVLTEKGFLCIDVSEEETCTLLNLMPLQEVRALCKCFHMKVDGKKENLVKALIDFGHHQKSIHRGISKGIKSLVRERAMKSLGEMVKLSPTPRKLFLRIMLLHALPLGREMEMDGRLPILNEVSRVKSNQITYPDYLLHPLKNFFGSCESLIRYHEALELLAVTNGKMLSKYYDEVLGLYDTAINYLRRILKDDKLRKEDLELPPFLRSFTAGHALVRAVVVCIDCLKMKKLYSEVVVAYQLLLSQDLYVVHHRGKWYDQLALTHHYHLKDVPAAVDVLMKGLSDKSLSPADKLLLSNRGLMITNRKAKNKEEMEKNLILKGMLYTVENPPVITITATSMSRKIGMGSKFSYLNESSDGKSRSLSSVEEAVIHHHKQLGFDKGIHAENAVSMSIFGVFFWDIIYTLDVDNVFLCPYQSQPLDLKSGDFYQNRKEAIDKRLSEMENVWTIDKMKSHLRNVCPQEHGKESIVSWRTFEDLDQFEILMECVGLPVISKICKRMAENFPLARRGFPDVIIWNSTSKKCKFLEVKGPGDRLSPFQILWVNYLNNSGADAAVCHVKSQWSRSLKRQYDDSDDNE
ncbi:fanconi-associated nuclease 1-like [Hetaerina americana]|uniref:fanconi-associated nuclease 1-like n=1 Tax=Hetaerina americana TaxID=62018 RepID=UPI003A7F5986